MSSSNSENHNSPMEEKMDLLIQEVKQQHIDAEEERLTSLHSSPCSSSEQLSPCVIESIKKVDSLKKDFQRGFEKIEKNLVKKSNSTDGVPTPIISCDDKKEVPDMDNAKEVVKEGCKVEKELFKEKIKPQRKLESSSRLLAPTRSNSAKRAMPAKRREEEATQNEHASKPRCSSTGLRKRPTQPQAPRFTERPKRSNETTQTSEEMELAKVQKEKTEADRQIKSYQKMFQVLKTKGSIPTTVRSVKELTVPMTPNFPTDGSKRKRIFTDETSVEEKKKPQEHKMRTGPTIPTPFHFASSRLSVDEGDRTVIVNTSGEMAQNFAKNTRSSYVPKHTNSRTQPKAPTFRTEQRSNSVGRAKPLSRDEIEEKEMKEAQAHAFKAKPVNKKIFEGMGVSGVPKVPVKGPTKTSEFHLSCDDRAVYHETQKASLTESQKSKEEYSFKALEMPNFAKPESPRVVKSTKLTETHSPKFSGKERSSSAPARRQKPSHEEVEKKKREEANSWRKKIQERLELTTPKDVHLKTNDRGQASQHAMKERIRRQLEQEKAATEVHATPLNEKILKKSFVVSPSKKHLTEFSEFKLKTEERQRNDTVKSMEDMQRSLKEQAEFHARPMPSTTKEPKFKTKPSEKEPVTPQEVHLNSERRSLERRSFDAAVSKAKEEEKVVKEKQKAQQIDKENFNINKLRRTPVSQGGMSFKASAVATKDPYPVKHVESTPLTEPKSPTFKTALRARAVKD